MSGRFIPLSAAARGRRLSPRFLSANLSIAALLVFCSPPAPAQVVTAVRASAGASPVLERGFSVVFDDRLSDSLGKFEEQVQARAWEKAFRIIADVPEDKWSSMLPDHKGFIRPASERIRGILLELPADGREAYRIFFDAKARLLFDTVRTAQKEDDVRIARTIYERYFLTSVGDDAADRLADDLYQRGEFGEAARCWKSIFDYHPDTNLPEAKLHVKLAMALLRAGLRDDFQNAVSQFERDFPAARVVIGGREVNGAEYLKGLAPVSSASIAADKQPPVPSLPGPERAEGALFSGLAPAENVEPAWRHRFLEESDWESVQSSVRNFYGGPAMAAVVPAATTDGKRIYCNWLGFCFAIDAASGKQVWAGPPDSSVKAIVNRLKGNNNLRFMFYSTNVSQFALTAARGIVLCVTVAPNHFEQPVQWGNTTATQFHLAAYEGATGKELWNSLHLPPPLASASFIGTPLIDGDSILAVTHQPGSANELFLRRLDLKSGIERWSLRLGTPQLVGDPDWGQQYLPIPYLALSGPRLYILTDDGALLAVDVGRRRLEWAFKYDPPANAGTGRRVIRDAGGRHSLSSGPIAIRDGVIYFKESCSPTLFALEEAGPRLKWKWQDAEFANLVGVDERDVYLFSNELSAIPRAKPETRWSNRLSVEMQGIGAHVGTQAVLVFTPRGLFELSKETGDVRRIFRGADLNAAGGTLLIAGNRLVSVSNVAVTAYPAPTGH